jgi:hypothetical protein
MLHLYIKRYLKKKKKKNEWLKINLELLIIDLVGFKYLNLLV